MTNSLGNLYDITNQWAPVADLAAGNQTGVRINMKHHESVTFVVLLAVASAGTDNFVPTVKQHTASSSGTTADLAVITKVHIKSEASLDGDEVWATTTQAAAATITLTGATYAALQVIAVVEIDATQLTDGYGWVSIDMTDPGTGGTRAGTAFAILNRPYQARTPANLPALLA